MSLRISPDPHADPAGLPDAARLRWQGVLSQTDRDWCRRNGIALAFDPAQAGWVVDPDAGFADDAPEAAPPLSHALGLTLRPWTIDDLPTFHALLDDPQVWAHLPEAYPAPLTRAMAADLIEIATNGTHHMVRAVVLADRPVGQVRLEFGADPAEAELSYWLGRTFWGRGIGRRMVARAVDWATSHPALTRLSARVRPSNTASSHALVAAGFRRDGQHGGWDRFTRPL
ncbi:MAG: GNAT family N-acetyltransferase [Gemmobacter sp.]